MNQYTGKTEDFTAEAKFNGTVRTVYDCPSRGRSAQRYDGEIRFLNGETETVNGFNCSMGWSNRGIKVDMTDAKELPGKQY